MVWRAWPGRCAGVKPGASRACGPVRGGRGGAGAGDRRPARKRRMDEGPRPRPGHRGGAA